MGSSHNNQQMKIFQQTSNEPYLRHDYKVVYDDGTYQVFDNYEDVQLLWWNRTGNFLSHIEVIDRKQEAKGFK
jgi:hypothetical protein